jgi:6,7-dimethyl-8-ribityllumazine synthase
MKSSGQPETLPDARGLRMALVVSRFNPTITQRLRDGAMSALTTAGVATARSKSRSRRSPSRPPAGSTRSFVSAA